MSFKIENGVLKKYRAENGETEVVIPDSVTTIGKEAFYECESLTSVTIPDSVTTIGYGAFEGCESLKSVTIPYSVTEIGIFAFRYCESLKSVTIPDSVTEIGYMAFCDCESLKSVTIPDSVTEIGGSAFSGTKWLKEYPEDLVIVGNGILIKYKGNDENVVIPDSVTTIGYEAFRECESLKSVTIPDSVTTIGGFAFHDTKWLEEYPEDLVIVGNGILINYKGNDENVVISDTVITIGAGAFCECESLKSVTIPDSVTTIGDEAFEGCLSLTSVTIPKSVTTIGNLAFEYCESLKSVTIKGVTFKTDYEKFSKDISEVIKLPETKDFSAKLYSSLKMAVVVGYYLQSGDEDFGAYIKKKFTAIMKFLIDEDNVGTIIKLLETGKFVTAKNITTFIDYANSLQKMEIQLIFMNYSHEHFKPQKPKLKL